jgi:hypothetical protein
MGMFDTVLVVDDIAELSCAHGHALRSFQTKDIDEPWMSTYLVHHRRLYRAESVEGGSRAESEHAAWRFEGGAAVREQRYTLSEVRGPLTIDVYGNCNECEPVLVRTDEAGLFGDIVSEHALFVDFRLTFSADALIRVERTSGTRDGLKRELAGRGVYVLRDDEPLALAHRELAAARRRGRDKTRRPGRRV